MRKCRPAAASLGHRAAQGLMSDLPENRDPEGQVSPTPPPAPAPGPAPEPPQAPPPEVAVGETGDMGDDGGEGEGEDEGMEDAAAAPEPQGGAPVPGQPGLPGQGKRRRRRRRRRGIPVLFTPEGQAYRVVAGPDGQPAQVFLTPQELQQYQQRLAQQQAQLA